MTDKLTICPRCTSDACYEIEQDAIKQWTCFGCGFYSNNVRHKDTINYDEVEEVLPNLYKDLRFFDENGFVWYPMVINLPQKGMVFVDGNSAVNWRWAAVQLNFENKPDMTTMNHYDPRDFMEALDSIGYFEQQS